ncbi:MAG: inorganic phosphate transporter [Flavobacteriales bacterium]|nr:inorganic phosphate transporter [Flavobacteriales bacterium]
MFGLDFSLAMLLIVALLTACVFEFINGFHDTANAVATVIYTKSLKPQVAVIWSGFWNFIGVYFGGIAVAMGIVNLLPLEALVDQNIYHNIAMIFALILTAIMWNIATWYLGIPCSSSHTLLGSIFGVGIAFMFISAEGTIALNWKKVIDAGIALLISPLIGFGLSMLLMFIMRKVIKRKKFFRKPDPRKKPPFWIRLWLIATCTSVSFSHGSNDGQKGVGLIMIILIAILPAKFALDSSRSPSSMIGNVTNIELYINKMDSHVLGEKEMGWFQNIKNNVSVLSTILNASYGPDEIPEASRFEVRKSILELAKNIDKLLSCKACKWNLNEDEQKHLKKNISALKMHTEYAPWWVILMISVSLGLGTMIGWKKIVITIGEKIGKTHLSYAQGASAEMIAASTIGISTLLGLPVSTTHVLSSGVAGSMVAKGGLKNLQFKTVANILIAWLITIPVTIILSASLFLLLRTII